MKSILKKLDAIYGSSHPEVRIKARTMFVIAVASTTLLLLSVIVRSATGNFSVAGLSISALIAIWTGMFFLFHSRPVTASNILLIAAGTGVLIIAYNGVGTDPAALFSIILYAMIPMFSIVLFGMKRYQYYIIFVETLTVYVLALLVKILPQAAGFDTITEPLIGSTLVFFSLFAFLLVSNRNSERLIGAVARHSEELRVQLERQSQLLGDVEQSLDTGSLLQEKAALSREMTEDITLRLQRMEEHIQSLNVQIRITAHAQSEVIAANETVKSHMVGQHAAVSQSSSSIEEISSNITSISESAREKKQFVDQLNERLETGERSMNETRMLMDQMDSAMKSMLDIITVIEDITDRTNLLAMNASIESAHAGELGRGFGVVAQEIRKLSEETRINSADIRSSIKENQALMDETQRAIRQNSDSYSALAREVIQVSDAFEEILVSTLELETGTRELLRSTVQLEDGHQQVDRALEGMEHTISSTDKSITHIVEASDLIKQGIGDVMTKANTIQEAAEEVSQIGTENLNAVVTLRESLK